MASYENATTHSNNQLLVLQHCIALWEAQKGERGHARVHMPKLKPSTPVQPEILHYIEGCGTASLTDGQTSRPRSWLMFKVRGFCARGHFDGTLRCNPLLLGKRFTKNLKLCINEIKNN